MKHIAFDNITGISADSENVNFPVEQLLDEHPKRKWKADATSVATVTIDAVGGCGDIMIAGTNAETASVVGSDPNWAEWGDNDQWGGAEGDAIAEINQVVKTSGGIVDVFLYDISADSDGGVLAQEAGIKPLTIGVVLASSIELYYLVSGVKTLYSTLDLTGYTLTSVPDKIQEAILPIGTTAGMVVYDLLDDSTVVYTTATTPPIINDTVNDVAMFAPLGKRVKSVSRGLVDPYIGLATDGGVSVVDGPAGVGTVVDGAITLIYIGVRFDEHSRELHGILKSDQATSPYRVYTDYSVDAFTHSRIYRGTNNPVGTLPALLIDSTLDDLVGTGEVVVGGDIGLTFLKEKPASKADGMVNYVTSDYQSGWMQGDIEVCLSGEDLTDKSVAVTAITDNGTAIFTQVNNGELYYTTATGGTITAPVTTGGECYGWEFVGAEWVFRETIGDWVGVSEAGGLLTIADGTSFTLLKYTNSSPDTGQIEFIYKKEKKLFEIDAKCTIQGSSDAVTALSFDEEKQVTLVGTSQGVTAFHDQAVVTDTYQGSASPTGAINSLSATMGRYITGTSSEAYYHAISTFELTPDEWANVEILVTGSVTQDAKNNTLWITLSEPITVPCEVAVTLTGPVNEVLYAGVMRASIVWTYGDVNPKYGIGKEQEDFSIKAENSNGSRFYEKRDIVRVFDLNALMLRSESREFEYFFKEQGENPTAWRLTSEDSNDFVVFGRMDGSPRISDAYPEKSPVTWRIIEVI